MFRTRFPLRFAHCDPAGIIYYPRYFELCDAAVEDWTPAILGVTRRAMHLDMRLGLPTVDLHASFAAVSRLGDVLEVDISLTRIGRSSIDLGIAMHCGGEPRLAMRCTQVLTDLARMRSVPWPDDLRDRLQGELS